MRGAVALTPWLYGRLAARRIWLKLAGVLLLVDGIFLAERLAGFVEVKLKYDAAWSIIVELLACTVPDVIALALPIALVGVSYLAVLELRENRELVLMAGVGVGPGKCIAFLFLIGLAAAALSLAVSGTLKPEARFLARAAVTEAQRDLVRSGTRPGGFHDLKDYDISFGAPGAAGASMSLFALEKNNGSSAMDRVIVASRTRVRPESAGSGLILELLKATIIDYPATPAAFATSAEVPLRTMRVGSFSHPFQLGQLLPMPARGIAVAERTTAELYRTRDLPAKLIADELGGRLVGGMLCLLAPLLGGLAVTLTTRATRILVLPAFCMALMLVDVGADMLSRQLGAGGATAVSLGVAAAAAVLVPVVALIIMRRAAMLVFPAMARS